MRCESCGMPIEAGPYCHHCVDEEGNLQDFDERLERMVAWTLSRAPELDRAQAERRTLEYMGTLPAWKDHPRVRDATSS